MTGIGVANDVQQIGLPLRRESVDQLMGKARDARPQPLDGARHEGAVHQPADARMSRRLESRAANGASKA